MTTPLYELTVGSYTQVLESTVGFLEKGLAHCQSSGTEPKAIVASTLYEDMQNFLLPGGVAESSFSQNHRGLELWGIQSTHACIQP